MNDQKSKWSRRRFIGSTAAGVAGIMILPGIAGCKSTKDANDIKLGFIGLGQQAMFLLNGFIQIPGVTVVTGCDVYGIKRKRFEKRVSEFYQKAGRKVKISTCEKFEDILSREDINAVVIAVPDHSHARIAIAASKAGKDIYLEKP
jgi:predicted dehydrogenase